MIECAITMVVYAIVILAVLFAVKAVVEAFGVGVPAPIQKLFGVLAVLLIILLALRCFVGVSP